MLPGKSSDICRPSTCAARFFVEACRDSPKARSGMQDPINSVILFAILCASSVLGFFVHPRLPERHRTAQSIALVQLAISLLVTFTAIVLGLLTTSVKEGYDTAYNARGELRRPTRPDGPVPGGLWTGDGADPGAAQELRRRRHRQHVAGRAAAGRRHLSEYIEHAVDRRSPRPQQYDERKLASRRARSSRRTICTSP